MAIKQARDYKREYALYHGKPKQIKRRALRNKARRIMVKAGKVRKGDGKDIHHRDNNPKNSKRANLAVLSRSRNRSIK